MNRCNLCVIFAVVGLMLSAGTPSARAEDVVRLGHNRTWSNPALLVGLATGAFKQAGVDVVEQQFTNPADIITAMVSGSIDAGASPGPTLFTAIARGAKVKAVAILQGMNVPPIAYCVRADAGINTVQDLRGKIAAVNNYGGTYDIYLRYWLEKHGLDPKKDIRIDIIPVPALLPALINKQVDIAPLAAFDLSAAQERYPGQTKTLFDTGDVMKEGTGANDVNGLVLVMSDAFISQHRDTAVKFLEGYLRAIHAMNQDPKTALDEWADFVGNKALRSLSAPPVIPDNGKVYLASLQFDADEALHYGYLPQEIDVHTMVDSSLIEAAAAKIEGK